ncbi:hypothetical protein [Hydrococcus rivularis]|nr:hypothetical protein [Hydrococcus rivularis]
MTEMVDCPHPPTPSPNLGEGRKMSVTTNENWYYNKLRLAEVQVLI